MKFRSDINGLRAYAVIAVVLFHFNSQWLPGGFVGVDVFFVISGYLMTSIIFRGLENNSFSIWKFFNARIIRIIPALAVLCLTLLILGWFCLHSIEYKQLDQHITSSITFVSNIVYWKETGYFSPNARELWLLHTWSLSVEWQFYMLYPIILLALSKIFKLQFIKKIILITTVLSLIFSIYASYKWTSAAYFLLPTRVWEMLLGGVAFLYPLQITQQSKKLYLEWAGIFLIILSFFIINDDIAWPGYAALLPTCGAFILIQSNNADSIFTNNIVSQKLGLWSYSIYLWHWPLVVAIYTYNLASIWNYIGIVISILLGFISYSLIEKIKYQSYYKCIPLCMGIIVFILSYTAYSLDGNNHYSQSEQGIAKGQFLEQYHIKHQNLDEAYWLKCNTYSAFTNHGTFDIDPTCITKTGEGGVFLWGDSHAEALSKGIRKILQPYNIPFYQKTSSACFASLYENKVNNNFKQACDHSNKIALESIKELRPSVVVIAQVTNHDLTDWNEITEKLKGYGVKKVLLIGPISQWSPSLPKIMAYSRNWQGTADYISDRGLNEEMIYLNNKLKNIHFSDDIQYISLVDSLCYEEHKGTFCRVKVGDTNDSLIQVDYGHLSEEGSIFVANTILKEPLFKLLSIDQKTSD